LTIEIINAACPKCNNEIEFGDEYLLYYAGDNKCVLGHRMCTGEKVEFDLTMERLKKLIKNLREKGVS